MTAPISPLAALAALHATAQALVQGTASWFDLVAGDLNQLPNFYGTIVHTGAAGGRRSYETVTTRDELEDFLVLYARS